MGKLGTARPGVFDKLFRRIRLYIHTCNFDIRAEPNTSRAQPSRYRSPLSTPAEG